jgi:hypothetical protein
MGSEPLDRIGGRSIGYEAVEAGVGLLSNDVDDLLVEAQAPVRQTRELHLAVPVSAVPEVLNLPHESGRLGHFQASDREKPIVGDAAGLVQEDRGDRVVGRQCGRLRATSGSRHKEEYLPSST